jgi:hypothetical protein
LLKFSYSLYATLAQSAEQLIRNEQVVGSIPTGGFQSFVFLFQHGRFVTKVALPKLGRVFYLG